MHSLAASIWLLGYVEYRFWGRHCNAAGDEHSFTGAGEVLVGQVKELVDFPLDGFWLCC